MDNVLDLVEDGVDAERKELVSHVLPELQVLASRPRAHKRIDQPHRRDLQLNTAVPPLVRQVRHQCLQASN